MLCPVRPGTAASAIIAAVCVTLLAACSQTVAGVPGPATAIPADAPVPQDLQGFYDQQLTWGPCADYASSAEDRGAFADPRFECTRIRVPIDYAAPEAGAAELGLLRQQATGDKIGSLLFNPGGPGQPGLSLVTYLSDGLVDSPLSERFDLVGFDPRGVGSSTPTIDCLDDEQWEAERADVDVDPSPAGVEQTEVENREFVQQCIDGSGGAQFLANIGTRDVVRDLDIIRQVLGDEKLSYVGYSYGTRIGSAYAEQFPQNVRALVLDGALDPNESTIDRTIEQNAGFQLAFEAFAADCATRPGCAIGPDPAQATAVFQGLLRPLIDNPLPVGERVLSYDDAVTGAVAALYSKDIWDVLVSALDSLRDGDGRLLLLLADSYYGRADDGSYDDSFEAFIAISCMDEQRITDRAQVAEVARRANEAAPFSDPGLGAVGALDVCAFWPAEPTALPGFSQVQGLPPTLVVSVTGDPATPYQAGVDLAVALGGRLVSVEGNQHTASLEGNACIDDVVTAYLVDLTVPAGQTNCTL
jgi:pimeloyl-ACP methyl ester carboxylesterase